MPLEPEDQLHLTVAEGLTAMARIPWGIAPNPGKIERARTPATAFFPGARGGNPRISGISPGSTPARVPSWGEVSRKGAFGNPVWRIFSGHFRTSRSEVFGGRRAVGGHGARSIGIEFPYLRCPKWGQTRTEKVAEQPKSAF